MSAITTRFSLLELIDIKKTIQYSVIENVISSAGTQLLVSTNQSKDFGLALCMDRSLALRLEPVQLFNTGETEFLITAFDIRRLAVVYEKTTSIQQRTDVVVKAGRLVFEDPVTGSILCVPYGKLDFFRTLTDNTVQCLWIDKRGIYQYRNLSITSVDAFTGSTETLEFALTSDGTWQTTLESPELPDSIYVRIPNGSNPGVSTSIQLSVNRFL